MKSHINAEFRKAFRALPPEIQQQARKTYRLFKQDPYHPSLHFKSIHQALYSVRASLGYRALGIRKGDTIVWFWIGTHADYDKLVKR